MIRKESSSFVKAVIVVALLVFGASANVIEKDSTTQNLTEIIKGELDSSTTNCNAQIGARVDPATVSAFELRRQAA